MGKTALTLSMARNIAVGRQTPVAFFSLEMSSVQLITRLISAETGLSSEKLRTGKLAQHEWQQLNFKVSDLEKAPLYICLLYTSPSPRDRQKSRMPSSA